MAVLATDNFETSCLWIWISSVLSSLVRKVHYTHYFRLGDDNMAILGTYIVWIIVTNVHHLFVQVATMYMTIRLRCKMSCCLT